ncbi:hypothetical protein ARMGADRAFT_1033831 [Armillaria gallica]|uniref:Uncharacterized protein n=1 Tax=Armillaria gallica TaxID=47427 RepID=A0A2H3DIF1_ARMGA|nr:hypothetical protein ARMGADRAFT_1033831 [Armillaria gallica]
MDNLTAAPLDIEAIDAVDPNVEHGSYVTAKRVLADCDETEQDKDRMKIVEIIDDDEVTFLRQRLRQTQESMGFFLVFHEIRKQPEELRELDNQHDGNFRRLQEKHNLKRAAIRTHHVRSITEVQTTLGMAATSFQQQIVNTIESESLEQLQKRIHDAESESTSYHSAADECIRALQTAVAFTEIRVAKLSSNLDRTWQEINKHYQQDSDSVVADINVTCIYSFPCSRFHKLMNPYQNARGMGAPSLHDSITPDDAESVDSWFSAQE